MPQHTRFDCRFFNPILFQSRESRRLPRHFCRKNETYRRNLLGTRTKFHPDMSGIYGLLQRTYETRSRSGSKPFNALRRFKSSRFKGQGKINLRGTSTFFENSRNVEMRLVKVTWQESLTSAVAFHGARRCRDKQHPSFSRPQA